MGGAMASRAAGRAMGAWRRSWWARAFLSPSDQARTHQPTRKRPTKRGERATYARPDRGNESEMLWAVLETTKERRVACCRNTRSDEGGDAR